jgi:hypothetical protein
MIEIEVTSNITVTIKGQTFVLSRQEAVDLFDKLEKAGVGDGGSKTPISPLRPTYVPSPIWPSWSSPSFPNHPIWYGSSTLSSL